MPALQEPRAGTPSGWAEGELADAPIDLVWTLRLRLVTNSGASFSMGEGMGPYIGVVALVVVGVLLWTGRSIGSRFGAVGLGLVLGGALGNVLDRAFRSGDGFMGGSDIDWIDVDADEETLRHRLVETPHTRVPVAQGSVDNILGVVQSRDMVAALIEGRALNLRELMRPLLVVPDQVDAMDALETLRRAGLADVEPEQRLRARVVQGRKGPLAVGVTAPE